MPKFAPAGFIAIIAVAGLIAYRVAEPSHLYVEADNTELLRGVATSQAGQASAQAAQLALDELQATSAAPPTKVPPRPTATTRPPTRTPRPTWAPEMTATPGVVYRVPAWTEVPVDPDIEPTRVTCADVTPDPYSDTPCEVRP